MEGDIRLRSLSKNTLRNYTRNIRKFLVFVQRPMGELDESEVRSYIRHLVTDKKQKLKSINRYSTVIRSFFAITLNCTMNYLQMMLIKVPKKLPNILT